MQEKIRLLKDRFIHRTDTYAIQWFSKESEAWRFWRVTDRDTKQSVPIDPAAVARHIKGEKTVGVYQLGDDDTVKWLCLDVDINSDIDVEDARSAVREHTRRLAKVTYQTRLPFLVEDSGNKGYHIWVFFEEPVPAAQAMALGRYLDSQIEPPSFLHVEVFPKQVGATSFGNLVKMPLGIHQKTKAPCVFVGPDFEPLPDSWDALENVKTVSAKRLSDLLDELEIDHAATIRFESVASDKNGLPCISNMLTRGAGKGHRDLATFKLGCFFRSMGVPFDVALAAMEEWNQRSSPPLDSATLQLKLKSAYNTAYTYFPCQETQLDSFCDTDCRFYASKMETRKAKYGS